MKKDKIKILILELFLMIFLFFALFVSNKINNNILALILLIYAIITHILVKKKKINSIYKNEITIILTVMALIYLVIFYGMGLYFGYYEQKLKFGITAINYFIIPLTLIIITSEKIRESNLSQKIDIYIFGKKINISVIITFISMVLIDLIVYTKVYDLSNYNDFITVAGFIAFASIASNLLYTYISNRYGNTGIIIYRLITALYVYIIPIIPNIYIFFRSFLRMLYPFIIYIYLEHTYSKNTFVVPYREKRNSIITTSVLLILSLLIIMLVSCNFKYGVLVVGSGSMSPTINMGDAVVFEAYKKQPIDNDEVIIFNKNNIKYIHRVVEITNINDETRYYTKGDANKERDIGYITDNDIEGILKMKIKYIGYPNIWIRDIFS